VFARPAALREIAARARAGGTSVRLFCVLTLGAMDDEDDALAYLDIAASLGVDNVIFRRFMLTDLATVQPNCVTRLSERRRVAMTPLLAAPGAREDFTFQWQVMGYYY
jgi:hypothetical protein